MSNTIFTLIFLSEWLAKIFILGPRDYFEIGNSFRTVSRTVATGVDTAIVVSSLAEFALTTGSSSGSVSALHTIRIFRYLVWRCWLEFMPACLLPSLHALDLCMSTC